MMSPFANIRLNPTRPMSGRQATRAAMYSRRLNDAEHATATAHCKRCHNDRQFFAFVAPDPGGRAQARVEQGVADWLACHPCQASYITNQGKQAAA